MSVDEMSPSVRKVANLIEARVPRPEDLPQGYFSLSWHRPSLFRNDGSMVKTCALGLIPGACSNLPISPSRAGLEGLASPEDVSAFIDWFDAQRDPQGVVDAIWGPA